MRYSLGTALGMGALLVCTFAGSPAGAQIMETSGPHNAYCGSYVGTTWTDNGNCVKENVMPKSATQGAGATSPDAPTVSSDVAVPVPEKIMGKVVAVDGHTVTLQHGKNTLVIDDQPAIDHNLAGMVTVGKIVNAHGLWREGMFYAHSFDMSS